MKTFLVDRAVNISKLHTHLSGLGVPVLTVRGVGDGGAVNHFAVVCTRDAALDAAVRTAIGSYVELGSLPANRLTADGLAATRDVLLRTSQ